MFDPSVLILGHSLIVRRLKRDLRYNFDPWAQSNFKLVGTVSVHLHRVGRHTHDTVGKLRSPELCVGEQIAPDISIL